ncbi:MAG TPA: cysteine synthase A [Bacillaceae bacterium]|nr:cysteine synthase A [Bacillaceae bacterium]
MRVVEDTLDLIGHTPLVRLKRFSPDGRRIYVKLETHNPGGSVKDRAARAMIERAEAEGRIRPGETTLVEASSGNTGIGLAVVAAVKGYRLVLVMPEHMPRERRLLLEVYGAKVVLTPAELGMEGAVREAERIARNLPNAFLVSQFDNPANPLAHATITARELLAQMGALEDVRAVVVGVGTAGTLRGLVEGLRPFRSNLKFVAVEPLGSPVLSGGPAGNHAIYGIGAGFVPPLYPRDAVDEVVAVSDEDAYGTVLRVARAEGLFLGPSSGAVLFAAERLARALPPGSAVVALAPDGGERYLSAWERRLPPEEP